MARHQTFGPRPMDKNWDGGFFGEEAVTTAQKVHGGIGFSVTGKATILRIRGNWLIKGTPDAVSDDMVIGLGIMIVSTDSATVGGTSVPSPLGDPGSPWLWHQYVPLMAGQTALLGQDIGSMVRGEIDTKAMRKIGPNQSLVFISNENGGGYASVALSVGFRVLFGEL